MEGKKKVLQGITTLRPTSSNSLPFYITGKGIIKSMPSTKKRTRKKTKNMKYSKS